MKLRSRSYPILGVLLALGAPLGHLALRAALDRSLPTPGWMRTEVASLLPTYVYLTIATSLIFALLGRLLGANEDQLEARATTDVLTGLANRRHFDARLREEVKRAARYSTPLSLLLIDVDNLKKLNAEGGHEGGDAALRAVGETLAHCVRGSDTAARVGGDEFAVLAPMIRSAEALDLAERIRRRLAQRPESRFATPTVSVGVAEKRSTDDAEKLIAEADHALFTAKERGRDRAVLART